VHPKSMGSDSVMLEPHSASLKDVCRGSMEDSENLLILHLRTAGIRKSREIELVNEVINIREKRKKFFHAFRLEIEVHEAENQKLQGRLAKVLRDKESLIAQSVLMTQALASRNLDTEALIDNLKLKYSREKEEFVISMKIQSERVVEAYKARLKEVDVKIEQLLAAKATYGSGRAESSAYDLSYETITELSDHHRRNVQK
jgi:hypothetical protein